MSSSAIFAASFFSSSHFFHTVREVGDVSASSSSLSRSSGVEC